MKHFALHIQLVLTSFLSLLQWQKTSLKIIREYCWVDFSFKGFRLWLDINPGHEVTLFHSVTLLVILYYVQVIL